MEETISTKQVFTRKEAAAYLGIHINTLERNKNIPCVRIGGTVRYRRETLDKFLADNEGKKKSTGGTDAGNS